MKRVFLASGLLASTLFLQAFGAKHSSVLTKAEVKNAELHLIVTVQPNKGMMVTKEGPWSLTLTNTQGLKLPLNAGKYESKEFDEQIPGFRLQSPVEAEVEAGKIEYAVRAFVCTEDKKHCYPQLHKGTIEWKK